MRSRPWVPNSEELAAGHMLLISEDYSKEVQKYGQNRTFAALMYSILSWREKFSHHEKQFNDFLCADLWSAESILQNTSSVEEILQDYSFSQKKIESVVSAATYFVESNVLARLRLDTSRSSGEEIREEIVESAYGVGEKFASLFLRMVGYHNLVVVDSNTFTHVEAQGFKNRYARTAPKGSQYLSYEKFIQEEASELSDVLQKELSPALWQATIYANKSTWKVDSGFESLYNLS